MLSGYASDLYDQRLSAWHRLEFTVGSRGLQRREVVWMNYEPPAVPFDMRYAGSTFRERQRIKRKQHRIRQRIAELPPVERALFLQWVSATYGDGTGASA